IATMLPLHCIQWVTAPFSTPFRIPFFILFLKLISWRFPMSDDIPSSPSDRRRFLKTGIAAAGVAGLAPLVGNEAVAAVPEPSPLAGKPNILIIMIDEARYPPPYESDALAQFRKTYLSTQEALRQNGIEFQRHYA